MFGRKRGSMRLSGVKAGVWGVGLGLLVGLTACSDEPKPAPVVEDEPEAPSDALTYHKDVRPLVEANCISCHDGKSVAPAALDFTDVEKVKQLAPLIVASIENRTMPPWQADTSEGCGDFRDDISLSQVEIDTFSGWMDGGTQLGDPTEFVAPEPRRSELGIERLADTPPTMEIKAGARYTPDQAVDDDFRCFVVDPGLEEDRFLFGWNVKPDNRAVLHHLIAFTAPGTPDNLAMIENLEAEDEAPGYKCFGGIRLDGQGVAAAWAPGADTVALPEGTAMRLPAGTLFVVQMHYNLAEGGMGDDQSAIDLWMLPKGEEPEIEGQNIFIGNLPFIIPPRVNGIEAETCDTIYALTGPGMAPPPEGGTNVDTIRSAADLEDVGKSGCVQQDFYYQTDGPLRIWSVAPHMHLTGQHISIEVLPTETSGSPANPTTTIKEGGACLIDMPRWDFNWQRGYWFKEPVALPTSGVVRLTCRYDNSGSDEQIGLGEGSGDEMCLGLLFISE